MYHPQQNYSMTKHRISVDGVAEADREGNSLVATSVFSPQSRGTATSGLIVSFQAVCFNPRLRHNSAAAEP